MEFVTGVLTLATLTFNENGTFFLKEFETKEPVKMEVCLEASRNTNRDVMQYGIFTYCRDDKGMVVLSGPMPEAPKE